MEQILDFGNKLFNSALSFIKYLGSNWFTLLTSVMFVVIIYSLLTLVIKKEVLNTILTIFILGFALFLLLFS